MMKEHSKCYALFNERETVPFGTENHNFLTMESLILAQDERWRRASYMQVER